MSLFLSDPNQPLQLTVPVLERETSHDQITNKQPVSTMKPKVYLETTIPTYLTAWSSRDLIKAAHQQITREWWENRAKFDLYISQIVIRESSGGDKDAAARRLEVLEGIQILEISEEAKALARDLVEHVPLPEKASLDALHIAIAVVSGMDYLLTWNCTHIANATLRNKIESICRSRGYEPPVICTVEELLMEE